MALEKYIVRSIAAVAAAAVAGPALAADLAVKAPQPVAAFAPSDIHGFFDVSFGGDYVTPRGVHVTGTGLTTQIATGLSADVYKNKNGFINKISLYGGVWRGRMRHDCNALRGEQCGCVFNRPDGDRSGDMDSREFRALARYAAGFSTIT
jgi:hypothetical protein